MALEAFPLSTNTPVPISLLAVKHAMGQSTVLYSDNVEAASGAIDGGATIRLRESKQFI